MLVLLSAAVVDAAEIEAVKTEEAESVVEATGASTSVLEAELCGVPVLVLLTKETVVVVLAVG